MSQLGYSEESISETISLLEKEETSSSTQVSSKFSVCGGVALASALTMALMVFGLTASGHNLATIATTAFQQDQLAPLTPHQDEPMPEPFWVTTKDVANDAWKVQDAFYNFFFLKGQTVSLKKNGETYSATFFDSITSVNDKTGEKTLFGYFNPVSPQGQPSNLFNFNYGDVDPKTGLARAGVMSVRCGPELAIQQITQTAPSRYMIRATTPQMCSPKAIYYYLKEKSVSVYDGNWWSYKIEFWSGANAARLFQYHIDDDEPSKSQRYFVGQINNQLSGEDTDMSFAGGDICPATNKAFIGAVKVSCGCNFAIDSVIEHDACHLIYNVVHPAACEDKVPQCSSNNLRAEISSHKATKLSSAPVLPKKFPRDLVAKGTGISEVVAMATRPHKSHRAAKK